MPDDLDSSIAANPAVTAILGVVGLMALKEMVGRFLRRSEKLESKSEERLEELLKKLLGEVETMRSNLAVWGERLTNNQTLVSKVSERVDEHGCRISALESGHAALRTSVEFLSSASTGSKDD